MVSVVEQLGAQEVGEYETVAPEGRPEVEKDTDWEVPETREDEILFAIELPWVTDFTPPLEREKSKEEVGAPVLHSAGIAPNSCSICWVTEFPVPPNTESGFFPARVIACLIRASIGQGQRGVLVSVPLTYCLHTLAP